MDGGLKYLSFHIKPNGYRSLRLVLVVTKKWKEGKSLVLSLVISRRQASSCSICASIYACLLAHLSQLPVGIMTRIQSIFTSFFWKRAQKPSGFHLASWDLIAKPKALGGWGIRNLTWFGQALAIKSLWRALFGKGLWTNPLNASTSEVLKQSAGFIRVFQNFPSLLFSANIYLAPCLC